MRTTPSAPSRGRSARSSTLVIAAMFACTAIVAACGDRSGKTLEEPVFPPPETTVVTSSLPPEEVFGPGSAESGPTVPPAELTITAPWVDGAEIPQRHTCDGEGISPALTWSNVPLGTVELALTVVDPDAGDYVHWLVYGIAPVSTGVVEGQQPGDSFAWVNSSGSEDWAPLCPPPGRTHRYSFTVHALDRHLETAADASAADVIDVIDAMSISRSTVSGTVTRDSGRRPTTSCCA